MSITVTPVNDIPSFTAGPSQTVNEDAGAQAVAGWAAGISVGPPNESLPPESQAPDFIVSSTNHALFSVLPAVSPSGTLTYTPAADQFGSASVTVRVHDDGGTSNGGVDTSAPQFFTITVDPVNDAPSFTKGPDQIVNEDAALQGVPGWATSISVGPFNETIPTESQAPDFIVNNNNNNNQLFLVQPAVSTSGMLTYRPTANQHGIAIVTVLVHDDGGTPNGGADTSPTQAFTITVNSVNDAPAGADNTVKTPLDIPHTFAAGDFLLTDPLDTPSNALLGVKITTLPGAGTLENNDVAVPVGTVVTVVDITAGKLKFIPPAGQTGFTSFTFQVQDDGLTAFGGIDLDPTPRTMTTKIIPTFTITFDKGTCTPTNDADTCTESGLTITSLHPGGTSGGQPFDAHLHIGDWDVSDPDDELANHSGCCSTPYEFSLAAGGTFTVVSVDVTVGRFLNMGAHFFTPGGTLTSSGGAIVGVDAVGPLQFLPADWSDISSFTWANGPGENVHDEGHAGIDNLVIAIDVAPAAPPNGGFELGDFTGFQVTGDTSIVQSLESLTPPEGQYMALLTSGAGAVEAPDPCFGVGVQCSTSTITTAPFSVPAGVTHIAMDFNFLSNEYPVYVPDIYDDTLLVRVTAPSGTTDDVLASVQVDFAAGSPTLIDIQGDASIPYNAMTGFQEVLVDVSAAAGLPLTCTLTFEIQVFDVADAALDSAGLIDNIRFVTLP